MLTIACYVDTLDAYIDKYTSMVPFLANGVQGPGWERPQPPSDAAPKEQISKAISMQVRGCSLLISMDLYHVVLTMLLLLLLSRRT
jgi:hypothetical protein